MYFKNEILKILLFEASDVCVCTYVCVRVCACVCVCVRIYVIMLDRKFVKALFCTHSCGNSDGIKV